MTASAWKSSLKTEKRPEKDQTKTSLLKDCSLVFSNFEIKDCKKTGIMNRLQPVFCSTQLPLQIKPNTM